ncbi:MAG: hypothetical protein GY901_14205 [Actinomycetia bacterium]|nr:hypothetical protein [Actinomycetales bacterium]MCP4846229.1 hypothetical protein [Actinomycetes bacterium]
MTMKSEQLTVGTSAARILDDENTNRRVYFHDDSSHPVYLGGSDVTTSNGLEVPKDTLFELFIPANEELWAVSGNADQTVSILYQTD